MRNINLFILLFLFALPPTPIEINTLYSSDIHAALAYIKQTAPEKHQFVLENVRSIKTFSDMRMNSGETSLNPAGEIQIAAYLFEYPELYFPHGNATGYIARLITHEARHIWQFNHWSQLSFSDRQNAEQDATNFARLICLECP